VFYGDSDEDQETRTVREDRAKRVCGGCPLREACLEYAAGDGRKLREPHGVFGGTTPTERRVMLKARLAALPEVANTEVPVVLLRTPQKQAVLAAVAAHDGLEEAVQAAVGRAGMDERAVLWQLSRIATLLGLGNGQRGRDDIVQAAELADVLPKAPAAETPTPVEAVAEHPEAGGPIRLPYPRWTDVPGQLQLNLGDAARPQLRIVIAGPHPKRSRRTTPVPLFALDAGAPVLLEVA
jgi:hypothetical protein